MAGRVAEMKEQITKSLHDSNKPWTSILAVAETKTGVDRLYLFIGAIAVTGLWLVFGYAAQLLCNTVGLVYPAYISMIAIESHQKDDDTKWLTYWVVFAIFSVVEYFADTIVGWFPLYWLIKCVILIWLMVPTELNGSLILYRKLIKPVFLKHQGTVDEIINKVKESSSKLSEKLE